MRYSSNDANNGSGVALGPSTIDCAYYVRYLQCPFRCRVATRTVNNVASPTIEINALRCQNAP